VASWLPSQGAEGTRTLFMAAPIGGGVGNKLTGDLGTLVEGKGIASQASGLMFRRHGEPRWWSGSSDRWGALEYSFSLGCHRGWGEEKLSGRSSLDGDWRGCQFGRWKLRGDWRWPVQILRANPTLSCQEDSRTSRSRQVVPSAEVARTRPWRQLRYCGGRIRQRCQQLECLRRGGSHNWATGDFSTVAGGHNNLSTNYGAL